MVVYVREAKGPSPLVLLWHVCLAKDKFLSENLPEQLSSAAFSFLHCGFPSSLQLLTLGLQSRAVQKGEDFQAGSRKELAKISIIWWLPVFHIVCEAVLAVVEEHKQRTYSEGEKNSNSFSVRRWHLPVFLIQV